MKRAIILTSMLVLCFLGAQAQEFETFEMTEGDTTFVMKKYYLLTYFKGSERNQTQEEAAEIQKQHLAHLDLLAQEKKICIAGPFGDDGDARGIVIYSVFSEEEAHELSRLDPAVVAGRPRYEIKPWWAAKGSKLF